MMQGFTNMVWADSGLYLTLEEFRKCSFSFFRELAVAYVGLGIFLVKLIMCLAFYFSDPRSRRHFLSATVVGWQPCQQGPLSSVGSKSFMNTLGRLHCRCRQSYSIFALHFFPNGDIPAWKENVSLHMRGRRVMSCVKLGVHRLFSRCVSVAQTLVQIFLRDSFFTSAHLILRFIEWR